MMAWLGVAGLPAAAQVPPAVTKPSGEGRVALVIGNAAYKESPLRNPVNDARSMAASLQKLGFEVMKRENAGQREMNRAISEFDARLSAGAVGLFYYAGHGMQVKGRNYLLPVDAEISSEASVRNESIDVDQILDGMASAGNPLNVVILDACRNNPFERRFRGSAGGLAQIDAPKGALIAYATAPGKVAADGEGANGLYTAELLHALEEPGLRVEDVFKRVRAHVAAATNDYQVPWEASSLVGDFYFKIGVDNTVVELAFWQSVQSSNDPNDFQGYLDKYPNGQFTVLARNRQRVLLAAVQKATIEDKVAAARRAEDQRRADEQRQAMLGEAQRLSQELEDKRRAEELRIAALTAERTRLESERQRLDPTPVPAGRQQRPAQLAAAANPAPANPAPLQTAMSAPARPDFPGTEKRWSLRLSSCSTGSGYVFDWQKPVDADDVLEGETVTGNALGRFTVVTRGATVKVDGRFKVRGGPMVGIEGRLSVALSGSANHFKGWVQVPNFDISGARSATCELEVVTQ
jgi:hypothetical protein